MSNMSYCRFRNTLIDLLDCYECWDDMVTLEDKEELEAQKRLLALCKKIVAEYGDQDE